MQNNQNIIGASCASKRLLALAAPIFAAALAASGCASIAQGTTQVVHVDSNPSGATCTVMREGNMLHPEFQTPQSLTVDRDKDTLVVVCKKDGFADTTLHVQSEVEAMAAGNVLAGGPIGLGIDAATGALRKYPANIIVPMRTK